MLLQEIPQPTLAVARGTATGVIGGWRGLGVRGFRGFRGLRGFTVFRGFRGFKFWAWLGCGENCQDSNPIQTPAPQP